MKYLPLISIITPTFNSQAFILQTYNCLLNQSYKNWEWIVTDDCSQDKTWEMLNSISKSDHRVIIFRNVSNMGAAFTRNNSLAHSKGDFIAFIDSDDLWESSKLKYQLDFMLKNDYKFTFTAYDIINETGLSMHKVIDNKNKSLDICYNDLLLKKVTLGCSTVMLDARYFSKIEMPPLRTGQDYALWLTLLKQNNKAYLLPNVFSHYRIVKGSISRNKFKKAMRQWQIYRKVEKINFLKSSWYFVNYAWRTVSR